MSTAPVLRLPAARAFQFRIATLLILMAWTGLVGAALHNPTRQWSGAIGVLTLIFLLISTLFTVYRKGQMRAVAFGFLLFCAGYLLYLMALSGTLTQGLESDWTPSGGAFGALFENIHRNDENARDQSMLNPDYPYYFRSEFVAVCNHAVACVLGLFGAIVAQILYAHPAPRGNGDLPIVLKLFSCLSAPPRLCVKSETANLNVGTQ
jgi:hypothetical protein